MPRSLPPFICSIFFPSALHRFKMEREIQVPTSCEERNEFRNMFMLLQHSMQSLCHHTCSHTYIHAYTHTNTYIHKRAHTHMHTHTHTNTYMHKRAHTHTHTYTHIHTHVISCNYSRISAEVRYTFNTAYPVRFTCCWIQVLIKPEYSINIFIAFSFYLFIPFLSFFSYPCV